MLSQIHIRNFAIIDELTLELSSGMTVLSGETGAGKSILVDALGLLLGDRAETGFIRDGAERAEVGAEFQLHDAPAASHWLEQHELHDENDPTLAVIRRVLLREGRTRAYINGRPCNARDLKTLGELLIDIHGQHAHQSLMNLQTQRHTLDEYAGCSEALERVTELARRHEELTCQIEALTGAEDEREQRLDFLRFQIQELEALAPQEGELDQLAAEHSRLANAERLLREGQQALALSYEGEEGAAYDLLGQAQRMLDSLAEIDDAFTAPAELASAAAIQIQESADTLRRHLDTLEVNPERLAEVESRQSSLDNLARKHHVEPTALPERLDALNRELSELEGGV
jgi:DNA repair protein RecN (Recombination protein N)